MDLPAWRLLRDAYQGLTGWQIDCTSESLPLRAEPLARLAELYGTQPGLFYVQRGETAQADATQVAHANDLARAIGGLLSALQQTRQALRHREAELATAVPVIARTVADTSEFDHRLQAILRGTVESLQGQAAALYLLDDATFRTPQALGRVVQSLLS